jgi:protein PhnA
VIIKGVTYVPSNVLPMSLCQTGAHPTDGDTVTVIKDLKPKGSGGVIKQGTKVKNIRLVDADHDIDCKIDGFGAMSLKTEFVRKV